MNGARTAPRRFCHWPAKAISANTGRQTRTRETDHPSPDAAAETLFHPFCFVVDTTRCRTDPARHSRTNPLIRCLDFPESLVPLRDLPESRPIQRILHHLDYRPTFTQTATASIHAATLRAIYRLWVGRTGKRPSLTGTRCDPHESSSIFQALKALYRTCAFQIAPF